MRLQYAVFFHLYCWLLFANPARAATDSVELTFAECIQQASEKNPALLAAQSELASSAHLVDQSYSNFYPQLSASLTYNFGNGFGTLAQDAAGTFTPSLNLRYNLFAGRGDEARIEQAWATRQLKEANLSIIKTQLSHDVKVAFAELLRAQELKRVNQDIQKQRKTSYELVSLLFESGRENLGSVLLAKANLAQSEFAVERSSEAIISASNKLAARLGMESTSSLRAKGDVPLPTLPDAPSFEDLAKNIPEVRQASASEEIAGAQARAVHSKFFPRLDFNSSVSQAESYQSINMRWLFGLTLSYSFFNGNEDYYSYKSARESKTAAMLNKRSVWQTAGSSIATAYYAYKSAKEQLKVDEAFLLALATQAQIAKENYNNGRLTFQNWDQIETAYVQRQQAIVVSKQNLIAAAAAFEKAIGMGVIQ